MARNSGGDVVWLIVKERALTDTRIRRIARKLQLSTFDVLGRCNHLWFLCYRSRSEYVDPIDADIATGELPGFLDALLSEDLVDRIDNRTLRVRGAQEAVERLLRTSEANSAKGVKSGEARRAEFIAKNAGSSHSPTAVQPGFNWGSTAVPQRSVPLGISVHRNVPHGYEDTLANSYDPYNTAGSVVDNHSGEPGFNTGSTPVQHRLNPCSTPVEPVLNHYQSQISEQILDLKSPEDHVDNFDLPEGPQTRLSTDPVSDSEATQNVQPRADEAIVGPVSGPKRTRDDVPSVAYQIAALLVAEITRNHCHSRLAKLSDASRAKIVVRWAESDIRKLHTIDKMDWSAIEETVRWCHRHTFWSTVILSADNLRSHWDQIQAQRHRGVNGAHTANGGHERRPAQPGPTELARREVEALEQKAKLS